MRKHWIKQLREKNIFAKIAALLLFLALFSCSDQGCIDADDFGEYESQTIEVVANASEASCVYDSSKNILDTAQGSGIKTCLTSGVVTVYDENNASYGGTKGCLPDGTITEGKIQNLCIDQCVQVCLVGSSSNSTGAKPSWTSTTAKQSNVNSGVTISPDSQIYITAIGSVTLGDKLPYPNVFIQAKNPLPHSKKSNWDDGFFDVRNGQSLDLRFNGKWNNGTNDYGAGSTTISSSGNNANDIKIYNGAKRLIAYIIPHPSGYDFDSSASTEKAGAKNVPLLPDPVAWQCSYTGNDIAQTTCGNSDSGYTSNGYTNVNNTLANSIFSISSSSQSQGLTSYGGMIRWSGDGVVPDSYDPFATANVYCSLSSGACTNISSITSTDGRIIGDASSSNVTIVNPSSTDSYKVSFKSLLNDTPNSGCDFDNSGGFKITINGVVRNIAISSTSWSSDQISLEQGQSIIVSQLPAGAKSQCGKAIAVKFSKYHDLPEMQKSGFVRFSLINAQGGASCTIKARIINSSGSYTDDTFTSSGSVTGFSADFYEYDNFSASSSSDPLNNLTVAPYSTWSAPIFVRKGQKIRFSPESWNQTFATSPSGLAVNCGIGMAMRIEPRPALLCRGLAADKISNPSCLLDYDGSGTLIGCLGYASECNKEADTSNYCPTQFQSTVTCTTNGIEGVAGSPSANDNYTKSGCTIQAPTTAPTSSYTSSCSSCSSLMLTNAQRAAKIDVSNLDQCYDLENYRGKVANIPSTTGFTSDQLINSNLVKGAVKLTNFNGSYGNFENFSDTGDTDDPNNGNIIFQLKSPMIFSQAGRLRFMVLDSNNLQNYSAYDDNSAISSEYTGTNGFAINLSGMLNFSNGQWMEARLCKEDSTGIRCRSLLDPAGNSDDQSNIAAQPHIIDITPPSTASDTPNITSPYRFDVYGNIIRVGGVSAGTSTDCSPENNLDSDPNNNNTTITQAGSYFYCHTYNSNPEKLRLSFKILDPETATCLVKSDSTALDGIVAKNPYYSPGTGNDAQRCAQGATIGSSTSASPPQCQKEFYCADKYSNNSGKYTVNIKVKKPIYDNTSSIISGVITPVIEVMDGPKRDCNTNGDTGIIATKDGTRTNNPRYSSSALNDEAFCGPTEALESCNKQYYCKEAKTGQAERVYKLLITDARYKAIVSISLVMMFTFYGLGFLMGISELNHAEIINRIVKIGLIYLFIGETGWDWFNAIVVNFFKGGTDNLAFLMASSFDNSSEITNAINNGDYYDKSILFGSVDKVFNLAFSPVVWKKISALLFASIFGWAYLIILCFSFMLYVWAVANAVLLYLTAQVFISILFTLGPIFFIFTLFAQTKDMFDNWLKQLIGFSLQQIFLLTTLAFFNMLMYEVIKMSLGYKICWDEVWTINIVTRVTLLSFWTIASIPPRTNSQSDAGNIGNPEGIPSLFSILFIWVIASLMDKFITFMTDLAAVISGGLSASKLSSGVVQAAKEVSAEIKKRGGQAWEYVGGKEMMQRADMALFDSGAMADKARKDREAANKKDSQLKKSLSGASDKAISDYKKENAIEFSGMDKDKQREKLTEIRDAAIKKQGDKLGLSEKEVKRLQEDKGFKYEGSNVFGAALSRARQAGGTVRESLGEKDTKTAFSASEARAAMAKMSPEDRKKFMEKAESGNVDVKRSMAGQTLKLAGDVAKGDIKSVGKTLVADPVKNLKDSAIKFAKGSVYEGLQKDYQAATAQLVAEGKINRMAKGTSWARSDDEKKAIRERLKQNNKEKEAITKKPDIGAITDLRRESQYLDDLEENSAMEKGPLEQVGSSIRRNFIRNTPLSEARKANEESAKARINKQFKKKLGADLDSAKGERAGLVKSEKNQTDAVGEINNEIEDFEERPDYRDRSNKISDLSKEIDSEGDRMKSGDPVKAKARTKAAKDELKKLQDLNKPLDKLKSDRDAKSAALLQTRTKISNIDSKIKDLTEAEAKAEKPEETAARPDPEWLSGADSDDDDTSSQASDDVGDDDDNSSQASDDDDRSPVASDDEKPTTPREALTQKLDEALANNNGSLLSEKEKAEFKDPVNYPRRIASKVYNKFSSEKNKEEAANNLIVESNEARNKFIHEKFLEENGQDYDSYLIKNNIDKNEISFDNDSNEGNYQNYLKSKKIDFESLRDVYDEYEDD